ncbi:nucleotidyltransferase family protein [Micromonospora sp. BL4]|uniref:nucleotidyltransferase family protein n=1 Tax=Micromonospora sp. BL4 TaxID=2478710 RepID=UPI000EF5CD58|nr:NTP transferase domain-containing protein [Micromonospora sp. BL4]RLP86206.1 nucleotidyltransferase family protein [Micromonospora sp. BL4]
MATAGLLLAAGAGRRIGMPKALLSYRDRPLVEHAAAILAAAGCRPVVVVLGAQADRVRALARLPAAVLNDDWATGMGSSLRAGLSALTSGTAVAAVVTLVDMPGLTPQAVRRVARNATADSLAVATYQDGRPGHPVLLGRHHWAGAAAAAIGDRGARDYLRAQGAAVRLVPCADVADDTDVDLPEQAVGYGLTGGTADAWRASPRLE